MEQAAAVVIAADTLRGFVADIFTAAGCARDEAERIGRYLLSANLAGHDSHGVIRVPRYVQMLQDGRVRAGQRLTIVTETPTHALVDGNQGFGQTVAPLAVDLGIAKAKQAGIAVIALRNAGHVGRVGDWGEQAAEAGLVSIHFVNVAGSVLVAPYGAAERRFSTNPICICIPVEGGPPLLLDFATSMVAEGKVLVASNGGKKVPDGALIGPDGQLSSDPAMLYGPLGNTRVRDATKGPGSLRTFGEHKGSGLAFMCEILAGCLSGGGTAGPEPRHGIANGMLSIYLDPGSFAGAGFAQATRDYVAWMKAARPASPDGEVLVPGEPEMRMREARLRDGIPLQAETWSNLLATGEELGIARPEASIPHRDPR
ncbi:MAG: malate/lactate/ureidoglycolate dehydrogenase [Acidisphaera sp.]|nr:malate/lactate/ureidoglycolate dehydrogenase [Acidisphaera sp.]